MRKLLVVLVLLTGCQEVETSNPEPAPTPQEVIPGVHFEREKPLDNSSRK